MVDFIVDNLGWIVLFLFAALIGLIFLAASSDAEKEAKFMSACMADKKEYECTAMWRAGNTNGYVPVVIPVPIR
jgi:hypothetical protein